MAETISWYVQLIISVLVKSSDFNAPNTDAGKKGDTTGVVVLFCIAKIRLILRNSLNYVYAVSQQINIHFYLQQHF